MFGFIFDTMCRVMSFHGYICIFLFYQKTNFICLFFGCAALYSSYSLLDAAGEELEKPVLVFEKQVGPSLAALLACPSRPQVSLQLHFSTSWCSGTESCCRWSLVVVSASKRPLVLFPFYCFQTATEGSRFSGLCLTVDLRRHYNKVKKNLGQGYKFYHTCRIIF